MGHLSRLNVLAALTILLAACASGPPPPPYTHQLVEDARQAVETLKARKDLEQFSPMLQSAAGVAVFPAILKAGFLVGAEYGDGVVLTRDANGGWSHPAFYTMGAGSIGLQLGAQQSKVVFILRSPKAVEAIIKHQAKLGADAGIAVGIFGSGVEGSATTALGLDIVAFTDAKGLFGGGSIEGAAMIRRNDYNAQYYGQNIAPGDILFTNRARNPQSDGLRASLGNRQVSSTRSPRTRSQYRTASSTNQQ